MLFATRCTPWGRGGLVMRGARLLVLFFSASRMPHKCGVNAVEIFPEQPDEVGEWAKGVLYPLHVRGRNLAGLWDASWQAMGNGRLTPIHTAVALGEEPTEKVVSIDRRRWKQYYNGLYKLPVAA